MLLYSINLRNYDLVILPMLVVNSYTLAIVMKQKKLHRNHNGIAETHSYHLLNVFLFQACRCPPIECYLVDQYVPHNFNALRLRFAIIASIHNQMPSSDIMFCYRKFLTRYPRDCGSEAQQISLLICFLNSHLNPTDLIATIHGIQFSLMTNPLIDFCITSHCLLNPAHLCCDAEVSTRLTLEYNSRTSIINH